MQRYSSLIPIQYDEKFKADHEVEVGLIITIERFYPDENRRVKVDPQGPQLEKFKKAECMFGMDMTILIKDKKQPR
ncbi:hypothetical protein RHGRI_001213 [Rhododendron griersonianum]|uniref:Uncharacterized protein n=1 Tax=Rhododendron griersonianum TaxID=479676 RepID=A0AAV6LJD1_9ERIC|nr:hypothetical protein RHGRI_001213 [Rhododendron griersonianum]